MREIKDFPNYYISETGVVTNKNTGRLLRQSSNGKGYLQLSLSNCGKSSTRVVHRMVYEAYVGEIKEGMEINHIDGNKKNNSVNNLEQITHLENVNKAVEIGLIKSGSNCKLSKGVIQFSALNYKKLNTYGSARIASKKTGVPSSSISLVCNGKRITAGGYIWKFKKES